MTFRHNRMHNMQCGILVFSGGENESGGTEASTRYVAVYNNLVTKYGTLVDSVPVTTADVIRGIQDDEKTDFSPSYRYLYHNTVEGKVGRVLLGVGLVEHTNIMMNNLMSAIDNPYGAIWHDRGDTSLWGSVTVAQNAITPDIPSEWTAGNSGFTARTNAFSSVFQDQAAGDLRPVAALAGLADQTILATGYTELGCDLSIVASKVAGARTQGNLASGTP